MSLLLILSIDVEAAANAYQNALTLDAHVTTVTLDAHTTDATLN